VKLWPKVWCLVFLDSRCIYIYDYLNRSNGVRIGQKNVFVQKLVVLHASVL